MCVVAYVSGHGFGHSAREIEVLRHLRPDIPLIVKTSAPPWFWKSEMPRPFDLVTDNFDVGCVQHDSIRIDIPATLAAYQAIDVQNRARFDDEADYLRRVGARMVVSDVPPFPLAVADAVGIPSALVCNFTWADIYDEFVASEPAFAPIVAQMRRDYAKATVCLDTDLSLPLPDGPRTEAVGPVARPATARHDELRALLPASARGRRLALVYLGNWGYPLDYRRLERLADWHFLSLDPPPCAVANWTVFPRSSEWPHPDLVASVDLVVSKAGYGIVAECLAAGTPILYPPRPEFAEFAAIDRTLESWTGGLPIALDRFLDLSWDESLAAVPDPATVAMLPAPGGPNAARVLADLYDSASVSPD